MINYGGEQKRGGDFGALDFWSLSSHTFEMRDKRKRKVVNNLAGANLLIPS